MKTFMQITCMCFVVFEVIRAFPNQDNAKIDLLDEFNIEDIIEENLPVEISKPQQEQNSKTSDEEESKEKVSYSGSQLWKVVADTKEKAKILLRLRENNEISTWGGNKTALDILVKPDSLKLVQQKLKQNSMNYEILIEDLQKAIDEENPPVFEDPDNIERLAKRLPFQYITAWKGLTSLGNKLELWPHANWGHRLTWDAYHRLSDIHGYLDYLAQIYPSLCSVETIGSSVQGKSIKLLKLSNGNPGNKAVWVDGGIHAREWITPATVTYIINALVEKFEQQPQALQNIDWYFLPVANPDGYEYAHTTDRLWRKNRARGGYCAGTDLNRNFGYRWGGRGSSKDPCTETYGGTGPFSEPETAAIRNFITSRGANWKAYVSFHSYGQYILYPWGYDRVVTTDHKDLQSVGYKAAAAIRSVSGLSYTVGSAAITLYPASGGSDDWAKGSARMKYAYTIELRDSGRYGFILPASYIKPTASEAFAALKVISEAAAAA